jgi:hypothetical protein
MKRLGIGALCLCVGCTQTTNIEPADVPRLAELEAGKSVWVETMDGDRVGMSEYREIRLYPKSGDDGYILRRPIRVHRWEGEVWLESRSYSPIPFDASSYSHAEVVQRDGGDLPFIIGGAVLGALVLGIVVTAGDQAQHKGNGQ